MGDMDDRSGPAVHGPSWVGVVAQDLENQRRFYRDVLGLPELRSRGRWVWFDLGEGRTLELSGLSDEDPAEARPGVQVGFAVEDLHAAREALIARGAEPVGEVHGGTKSGSLWCTFLDAEANLFQINQRLPPA